MQTRRVTPQLRRRLKRPFGKVYPGKTAAAALHGRKVVVAVGDIATEALLEKGMAPTVAVVDFKCRRRDVALHTARRIAAFKAREFTVDNPPGGISSALNSAIARIFSERLFPAKVLVRGEEDLAVVPAVLYAPEGAAVYYGQPGKGGVIVEVDAKSKRRFKAIFAGME
ncbi:MAG: DUF359 domain-containing protein [Candidatus Micrarchaeota archaeon]